MFGRDTIFVAGDRVQTDAIAVPFSMGRDLLCIYSKKHIENPPELKGEKSKHNRLVMKTMAKLFKEGGKCIWVAPSGGRDRPNAETGKFEVAPFDSKSIEMFPFTPRNYAIHTTQFPSIHRWRRSTRSRSRCSV